MSSPPSAPSASVPPDDAVPGPPAAGRRWSPWAEARRDWRVFAVLLAGLAVVGAPLGVLWWALAPRADFRITSSGPVAIGNPSDELLMADDGIFVLIVAALGLLVGVGCWSLRGRRGVAMLLGASLGTLASGVVAWRVGQLLGPGPTRAALAHVGGRVTTRLELASWPALAVGPFVVALVVVLGALYSRNDTLGRPEPEAAPEPAGADVGPARIS